MKKPQFALWGRVYTYIAFVMYLHLCFMFHYDCS